MDHQSKSKQLAAFGKTSRAARTKVRMGAGLFATLLIGAILLGAGIFYIANGGRLFSTSGGPAQSGSFILSGQISDAITGTSLGTTTTVDVIVPSYSLSKPLESPTQSSGAWTSVNKLAGGTSFYLHVASTAGNKYYDAVFGPYVTGVAPWLQGSCGSNQQCWTQGIPIGLYQESTAANIKFSLTDSLGSVCTTATGAAGATLSAHQGGNTGAITQLLALSIQLAGSTSTSPTDYGVPMPYFTPAGGIPTALGGNVPPLSLIAYMATNRTGGNSWIIQNGWTPTSIQPQPTVGQLYYKVLPALISSRTAGAFYSTTVPLDLTNGPGTGKHIQAAVWVSDLQLPTDAAQATPDGAPAAYGAFSTVGPSAVAFSFSSFTVSSGSWTGFSVACSITQ